MKKLIAVLFMALSMLSVSVPFASADGDPMPICGPTTTRRCGPAFPGLR